MESRWDDILLGVAIGAAVVVVAILAARLELASSFYQELRALWP